jgi:superfamily II DNA helicase RecQ
MKAIQDGASPVVAIMPTGGGKSMLFMLPAYAAPGGCTIVVVPLLSLRADLMARCQALGIACVSWESRRPPDEAAIVLVTPESTENPDFHTFLNRQRLLRRLDRIVIDKCHVILNQQKDFRPAMARLGQLVSARTQLVFLTATLPPTTEDMFLQRIQHHCSKVSIYRARTSRRNMAYRVFRPMLPHGVPREPHQWLASADVLALIRARICQARDGRVIVYANIKSQVNTISRELSCELYYSAVLDQTGVLQRFQSGQTCLIAATSALGMGIDIPDIWYVIHLGRPRTLLDYGQESGRAGRDRLASKAIIIHLQGWDDLDPWIDKVLDKDFERVQAYMEVVEGVGC